MNIPVHLQTYSFGNSSVKVIVPDAAALQHWYQKEIIKKPATTFPYWGKVWPAAKALCRYISNHQQLVQNKKVLELAAGAGLPSLLSALYAKEVCCSDYNAEAVAFINDSIEINKLQNISSCVIDWNDLPADVTADVLLVSDINYEPASFETLYNVLVQFISNNTIVLLSTPQRIMAKSFIERLLPFCKQQQEIIVKDDETETACSVMLLLK